MGFFKLFQNQNVLAEAKCTSTPGEVHFASGQCIRFKCCFFPAVSFHASGLSKVRSLQSCHNQKISAGAVGARRCSTHVAALVPWSVAMIVATMLEITRKTIVEMALATATLLVTTIVVEIN